MKVLIFVFLIFNSCFATRLISTGELEALFKKVFYNELTDEDTKTLHDVAEILHRPEYVSIRGAPQVYSGTRLTLDCIVCRSAAAALFDVVLSGQEDAQAVDSLDFLCVVLGIQSPEVCRGAVELNLPIITYIIRNTPEATPAAFCGLVLQQANDPSVCPFNDPRFEWQVELPPPAETVPSNNSASAKPLKIALITDAHIDPLYEANGIANCDAPTCCRKGQRPAQNFLYKYNIDESVIAESIVEKNGEIALDLDVAPKIKQMKSASRSMYPPARNVPPAGYWGDYRNCDTPIWAFDDVIDRITETHKDIDVVYYIGDSVDHGVWETTYELIKDMNRHAIDKIRSAFGEDVLVVMAIGNHEAQPTNQYAPTTITGEGLNTTWLYETLANKWAPYLSDEARESLLQRGGYSVLVKPGLRAISLNNNVAYRDNWWLVHDPTDSKKHLEWLVQELYKAEQAGEKVHLLLHIPPGVHDLIKSWTREYNRIVNRFSSTIAAEFNGHTHSDEFKIFYNAEGAPISVAWGAGGTTAYSNYNLNYKIATFDSNTYAPSSIQNYVYNLTEANLTPYRRPHWFQLYDMKNTFGLSDLSPASLDNLVRRMVTTDKHLLEIYSAFFSKLSDTRWSSCNESCKLDTVCKTVVTVLWERERCTELENLYRN
ncbi:hypothetical protein O0L34_g4419 [Tuta absoluta]|nr:hypothetical protein O0L34_g4419 [Tuta absoluta]